MISIFSLLVFLNGIIKPKIVGHNLASKTYVKAFYDGEAREAVFVLVVGLWLVYEVVSVARRGDVISGIVSDGFT